MKHQIMLLHASKKDASKLSNAAKRQYVVRVSLNYKKYAYSPFAAYSMKGGRFKPLGKVYEGLSEANAALRFYHWCGHLGSVNRKPVLILGFKGINNV